MAEENKFKHLNIETYADDMAKIIGDNQTGVVKKIIEEEEKHEALIKKTSPEKETNKTFLLLGIFFILLAFSAVFFVSFLKKEKSTSNTVPKYLPIIFTDKIEFKEISGLKKNEIIQTILNESNIAEFKRGGVEAIYLTLDKKVIGFRKFLDLIEGNLDQTKIDFINDNFLIGAKDKGEGSLLSLEDSNKSTGRDLFILIKMRSIIDVFSPMRLWESNMFSDMHKFFGTELNADTKYLLEKGFEDGVIQNKNARILYDNDRKIIMMYIFAEEDSLIITNSLFAADEVMLRLAASKIKK